MLAARRVADQLGLVEDGFRLVVNDGDQAGQTVHHIHVHVLGGRALTGPRAESGLSGYPQGECACRPHRVSITSKGSSRLRSRFSSRKSPSCRSAAAALCAVLVLGGCGAATQNVRAFRAFMQEDPNVKVSIDRVEDLAVSLQLVDRILLETSYTPGDHWPRRLGMTDTQFREIKAYLREIPTRRSRTSRCRPQVLPHPHRANTVRVRAAAREGHVSLALRCRRRTQPAKRRHQEALDCVPRRGREARGPE